MRKYKFVRRHPEMEIYNACVHFRNGYSMSVLKYDGNLEIAIIWNNSVFYGSSLLPDGVERVASMAEVEKWARKIASLPSWEL